jgi:hypothetical protein
VNAPLDISLSELADAARAAGRSADIEARAAGMEPAGIVAAPTEPRGHKVAHARLGRKMKGGASSVKAAARRKLGG